MTMLTSQGGIKIENSEGLTKTHIREKVYAFMIERNIARKPIPIFNRIPNFEGAGKSANRITTVEAFQSAQIVKVDPDKPLEDVRFLSLVFRKKLLVPSPRLQSGLFKLLWNDSEDDMESLKNKVQSDGIKNLSIPLDLNIKIKVDTIVSGAVAVSLTGRRIGKGEGFADLEYALMKNMNMISDNTFVIAMVHDCQVFDELPSHIFQEHDVPIDVIVTPTQIIYTKHSLSKPEGIYWNLLSEEKIKQIPILSLLQTLPKGSFFNAAEGNLPSNLHSASANTSHSPRFEGYDKGRGHISTHTGNRGRTPYNYNREQRDYNNYDREQRNYNNYEREQRSYNYDREHRNYNNYDREQRNYNNYDRGRNSNYYERDQRNTRSNYKNQDTQNGYRRKDRPLENQNQSRDLSKNEENDNGHIHVTISVDKQNHIVHRTVEESKELDRVGDANETPEGNEATQMKKHDFTIYIGGLPRECRFTDLREELKKRNVKPTYIAWKGFDYAFLDFKNSVLDVRDILESLKDLSFKGKALKVNHKQYSKDKSNQDEVASKRNKKNLNDAYSSTENSPKKNVKSTECQNDKPKTDIQSMRDDEIPIKQTDSSLSENNISRKTSSKEIVGSTECKGNKIKSSNQKTEIKRNPSDSIIESQNNNTKSVDELNLVENPDNSTFEDGWGSIDENAPAEDHGWM